MFNATACDDLNEKNEVFYKAGQSGDGIKVTIGANVTKIPSYMFYPDTSSTSYLPKILSVEFEENSVCDSIGSYAFYWCRNLTSFTIPDSVTSIGDYAFIYCNGLTSITIPNSVTSIGNYAFDGCSGLTSITIPNSVTSIGNYALAYCSGLTSVTIGNGVTSIGSYAFYECTKLSSVTIGNSVTFIGEKAFYNCKALTVIKFNATACDELSASGCLMFYSAGRGGDGIKLTIGANVTKIPAYLFYSGNSALPVKITSVEFEENSACKSIGDYAFSGCANLVNIKIPDSVTSIGDYAFESCVSLASITIPDSVTSIGTYAFYKCSKLTSVLIGNGVTSIVKSAFYDNYYLTTVYYKGTAEDWDKITIDSGNAYLTSATRYYYSATEPTESGNYWHYDTDGVTPVVWNKES
jgi:hypothetical protein